MKYKENYDNWMDEDFDDYMDKKSQTLKRMKNSEHSGQKKKKQNIRKKDTKRKMADRFNNDMDMD